MIVEITGIKEFQQKMRDKQEQMQQKLPESVRDATLYLHSKIKESIARGTNAAVAVDTGRFLNSVDFETTGENESIIFTDIEYAKFIEYGTSRMESRPHFKNTVFAESKIIYDKFKNAVKFISD